MHEIPKHFYLKKCQSFSCEELHMKLQNFSVRILVYRYYFWLVTNINMQKWKELNHPGKIKSGFSYTSHVTCSSLQIRRRSFWMLNGWKISEELLFLNSQFTLRLVLKPCWIYVKVKVHFSGFGFQICKTTVHNFGFRYGFVPGSIKRYLQRLKCAFCKNLPQPLSSSDVQKKKKSQWVVQWFMFQRVII